MHSFCVLFKCLLIMHHWDVLSVSDCLCAGLLRGICTASAFIFKLCAVDVEEKLDECKTLLGRAFASEFQKCMHELTMTIAGTGL